MRNPLPFLLVAILGLVQALSSTGNRLLVVLEEQSAKASFSQFWADLEARGYKISFESPKNERLSLFKLGERSYDHLLLTPPKSKGYGPALMPKILLDFINGGGNILLALSANSPTPAAISSLLLELDIHLSPDRSSIVVDHFNHDISTAAEKHDVLLVPRPEALRPDVKNYFGGDGVVAVPRAVGQTLGNDSPLLAPILTAPETAYSYNPKEESENIEDPFATGGQLALITAMQARNSARFTVLGSLEILENQWFEASVKTLDGKSKKTVNREFAKQLSAWTFKETGLLKVGNVDHYEISGLSRKGGNASQVGYLNPAIYRIKNEVAFSIEISEYELDHYIPFTVPPGDALQLEFTMLSPYQRLPLLPTTQTPNSTIFSTSFTVPDQHGIFTFKVNYKRPFLSYLEEKRTVTVRHFAHDEWPRSWAITGGWPWIAGLWSVVTAFLAFVALWLYSEPPKDGSSIKFLGGK
uniref:Dolichyl-diphosphooligosaccharide--protein glycosyltransferase subunit WBP1 n=1 Tax=Endocarpon pusillum TaxID=364733 RepID=F8QWX9_9EURO|nr:oligosaccharyl transferase subunit beta [Endocarpon pusillum]